ncbi:uncharacterized protein LOC120495514 isoform X2 [Pimephales promelas]|uniref:uncharacterized protein LOC120495514 isoform X2 n=1 Tax=Pimephales promelas TaxID=90988 RepID=UPI001955ECF5|nr:uncharacterized protein LOC120495514 isoform X2 [Pimephales promelas]
MQKSVTSVSVINKQEPRHVLGPVLPDITPSDEECRMFFEMLHHSEMQESKPKKSAILSVIEAHSHRYTPKVMQLDLPTPLSAIYSSTCLEMDLPMLLIESTKVFDNLQVTQQQFKASGFVINPDLPWIGATPDGQVTCTCHGDGVLEIKCPFNSRDRSLNESCRDSSFCLGIGEDGRMALKTDHKFMYQVQAQMHVSTWLNSSRLEYYQSCWGNGLQLHAILPQTLQPLNSHLKWGATVVNLVTQMTSPAHLDSVSGSIFTSLALN